MDKDGKSDKIFIVEHCENCRSHQWNTRHDEAKYKSFAEESKTFRHIDCCVVRAKILEYIPEAKVVFNMVPKEWVDYEIYC